MQNNKEIQTDRYTANRQLLITAALPIARQKLQDYFEGYSEFYLKVVVHLLNEFSRNPQDILHTYGCQTPLHVHIHLMFCAMYNKHTAAVSTSPNTDRASAL